jgi:hypothetical protein
MSTLPEYTIDEIKQLQSSDNVLSVDLNFVEQGKPTTQVLAKCTIWLTCDSKFNGFLLNTSALTFERPDLYLTSKSNCAS